MSSKAFFIPLALLGLLATSTAGLADTMYVAETSGQAVDKITSAGAITRISNLSSGTNPTGLAITRGGTIYAASAGHAYLVNITAGGTTLGNFGAGHLGLAIDGGGNFFAAETGAIDQITASGIGSIFAADGLSGTQQIAFDFYGNLFAASSSDNTIDCFTPGGDETVFASGLNRPSGLAFDASGSLYIANAGNNTIVKITGGKTTVLTSSGLSSPQSLAFDSSGTLYVANAGNGTIDKVSRTGVVSLFASGLNGPNGMAFLTASGSPAPVPFPEPTGLIVLAPAMLCLRRPVRRE